MPWNVPIWEPWPNVNDAYNKIGSNLVELTELGRLNWFHLGQHLPSK